MTFTNQDSNFNRQIINLKSKGDSLYDNLTLAERNIYNLHEFISSEGKFKPFIDSQSADLHNVLTLLGFNELSEILKEVQADAVLGISESILGQVPDLRRKYLKSKIEYESIFNNEKKNICTSFLEYFSANLEPGKF